MGHSDFKTSLHLIWTFFFPKNKANFFQPLLVASAREIRKKHDEHILAFINYFFQNALLILAFWD